MSGPTASELAQQQRERDSNMALRREAANTQLTRAAQGIAETFTQHVYNGIREDLEIISDHLLFNEWKAAGDRFGTVMGEMKFRSTTRLHPIWHYLRHPNYAPNSCPLDDVVATGLHILLTTVVGRKPPTLSRVIRAMSRELSHAASMGFIYRYQSRGAIKAIKERARSRKLAIPVSVREELERGAALDALHKAKPQMKRHVDPDDPFTIEDGFVSIATEYGFRKINVKTKHMPTDRDWTLLELCTKHGREWDTVAMILIGLFIKHSGMVHLIRKKAKGKKSYKKAVHVSLTPESYNTVKLGVKAWLDFLRRKEPMICRPRDGGYLTFRLPKITTKKISPLDDKGDPLMTVADGTSNWKAVEAAMAGTGYRTPLKELLKLRTWSLNNDLPEEDMEEFGTIMGIAGRACKGNAIYFPIMMDFRGRTYYRPAVWQPQGNDLCKALLKSAQYRPIPKDDPVTRRYMYQAIRGLIGTDKEPMPDEVSWDDLLELQKQAKEEGEEMWQCLTLDIEDSGQLYQVDGTCNGLQHLSALMRDPVGGAAVNLTQSGDRPADIYREVAELVMGKLQALADEGVPWAWRLTTGGLVLERSDTKKQVMVIPYGAGEPTIKSLTVDQLKKQVENLDAHIWTGLKGPEGKDTKAVNNGYGVFKDRPLEAHPLFSNDGNRLGNLLTSTIKNDVLSGAFELMSILKEFAKVANGRAIKWRTRSGDDALWVVAAVIKQYNTHNRTVGIHLPGMAQRLLQYTMRVNKEGILKDASKIDKTSITKGIVPNFIHSHDADHMARVAARMAQEGHHFTSIHDCFATTAAGLSFLQQAIREEFVVKYTEDHPFNQPVSFLRSADTPEHLQDQHWDSWVDAVRETLGEEAAAVLLRDRGLDIREVLRSDFFFC